jgi:acyl transferase domain-containing protein/D-arabinose 1-dehydrogenase-like Zn-dependent alcohol dehydrogenase
VSTNRVNRALAEDEPQQEKISITSDESAARVDSPIRTARLVPLSARNTNALHATAESYRKALDQEPNESPLAFADICATTALRRAHHDHRLAIVADSNDELLEQLTLFCDSGPSQTVVPIGRRLAEREPKLAFVFSGQGPQWWAMGRQLLETEPVYRSVIEECDELIRGLGPWSLLEELTRDEESSRMENTAIAQPSLFAVQVALAKLWQTWGIEPAAVVGHSVGEVAAAYVAGVFSLEHAMRVIYERGRCMERVSDGTGRMLAVGLGLEAAQDLMNGPSDDVVIAAVNSPTSVTFSGDGEALQHLADELEQRDVFNRFLRVKYAFHSPQMDPMQAELHSSLESIQPRPSDLPLYSTVTGRLAHGSDWNAEYWWQNVRRPVMFTDAISEVIDDGYDVLLEVAPNPVLSRSVSETAALKQTNITIAHSLRRQQDDRATLLKNLGVLYTVGCPVRWDEIVPADGKFARLPTYAWQHESHWHESEAAREHRTGPPNHPLLGERQAAANPLWESSIDRRVVEFLEDHCVQGHVLLSATTYIEMARAAGRQMFGPGSLVLENVELKKACFLEETENAVNLQFSMDASDSTFTVHSRPRQSSRNWTEHLRGKVRLLDEDDLPEPVDIVAVRARCSEELSAEECYSSLKGLGLDYGPSFRGIEQLFVGDDECLGRVNSPQDESAETLLVHPAILDACFQVGFANLPSDCQGVYLPVELGRVFIYGHLPQRVWSRVFNTRRTGKELTSDLQVFDDSGQLVAELRDLRARQVEEQRDSFGPQNADDDIYSYRWRANPRPDQLRNRRSADFLPTPSQLGEKTRLEAAQLDGYLGLLARNRVVEDEINPFLAGFILQAFKELGSELIAGETITIQQLIQRAEIAERYHRLMERYLQILEEDGIVSRQGDVWSVQAVPSFDDVDDVFQDMILRHPAYYAELILLGRCGVRLADILHGDVDPLHLIFPDGSLAITDHLYQDAPFLRFYNTLASRAVSLMFANLPLGRTLRVLEIGAGTGGMTSYIVPKLPADRTEYVYTDLSNHFFLKAQEKFRQYPFIEYQRLDIEQDPTEQGFEPHSFDLIVASEVLHATTDLRQTLTNTKKLLVSDGMLLLLEASRKLRWIDLVFGLTEGWWRFVDRDLRQISPLLPYERWKDLLLSLDFSDVCEASGMEHVDNAVILARGPFVGDEQIASSTPDATLASDVDDGLETEEAAPAADSWLIFAEDRGKVGEDLAAQLQARGQKCTLAYRRTEHPHNGSDRRVVDPRDAQQMQQLVSEWTSDASRGVVHLWNLDDAHLEHGTDEAIDSAMIDGNLSVVHLVQALGQLDADQNPRLWLVTMGAQSVGPTPEPTAALQAGVWGLNRVIGNESPRLRPTIVDLGGADLVTEIESLSEELLLDGGEDEIALRGDTRFVHRLIRFFSDEERNTKTVVEPATVPFQLHASKSGTLEKLRLHEIEIPELALGEVEIQVAAAGLNFSDVMKALSIYPGLPDGPIPMGIECSGTITRVAPDIEHIRVGDEVMAVAPFSFGSFTTTSADMVAPKPSGLNFEEAATIPIAFLTAHYALDYLGRLVEGDRVLIHAATGGVGLAAIQLARQAGAEVFATAGTPEKRELLAALGVEHIMDSRKLTFADEIMAATDGDGVDVVLNSLAGEAIDKGLSVLRDDGRFLEIGKRDIYEGSRMALRPFRKNLSFMAIDLDRGIRDRPRVFAKLFQSLQKRFESGELNPLPHRVFPVSNITNAFRYMAQAKHIGKVIVSLQEHGTRVARLTDDSIRFRDDATYLITGGLGGFGLTVARWMVDNGAQHLALVGRSGAKAEEAQQAVAAMQERGAQIVAAKVDVSDPQQVAKLLSDIESTMPPLKGVIHGAMVLHDALLTQMDEEKMRKVWAPKVQGAWNLHTQTLDLELDHFVMFSSISSVFGTGGQANYASANTVLDSLAAYRRANGLPGLAISWGYLGQVGFVARHDEIAKRFEAMGIKSFSPQEALSLFGRFLRTDPVHTGVMRVQWGLWGDAAALGVVTPRFADLIEAHADGSDISPSGGPSPLRALREAKPAERRKMLESLVRDQVARVLGTLPSKLDVEMPFSDLGLDSLMAVELKNWVEGDLRLNLPTVELLSGPSVVRLTEILLAQLSKHDVSTEAEDDASAGDVDDRDVDVDSMSEAEVDVLLQKLEPQQAAGESV